MLHRRFQVEQLRKVLVLFFCLVLTGSAEPFRCDFCRQQVTSGYEIGNKFYCQAHLNEGLPKCHTCNSPINGSYTLVSHKQHPICETCRNSLPQCFLCAVPSHPKRGGKSLSDGRHLCAEHALVGVTNEGRAKLVFQTAQRQVEQTFGSRLKLKTPIKDVRLVDLQGLIEANKDSGHASRFSSGRVLGTATIVLLSRNGVVSLKPSVVHLLNHVPESRMLTVSAHEYAHVWHAENHPQFSKTAPILREGFADWVAYKVAEKFGRDEEMRLLENPSGGIYYEGLKKLLDLERRQGTQAVLRYVTSATTL